MIGKLSKNKKFIFLDEKPKEDVKGGLKVSFQRPPLIEIVTPYLPIITCDIEEGKTRYYLPKDFNFTIIKIEIL